MSKPKKKKPVKIYTVTETILVSFQVVATSEEDAQDAYRNLPTDKWTEIICEAASCNYCEDEVSDEEDFDAEEHEDEVTYPRSEKAKKAIFHNSSLEEEGSA